MSIEKYIQPEILKAFEERIRGKVKTEPKQENTMEIPYECMDEKVHVTAQGFVKFPTPLRFDSGQGMVKLPFKVTPPANHILKLMIPIEMAGIIVISPTEFAEEEPVQPVIVFYNLAEKVELDLLQLVLIPIKKGKWTKV